MLEECNMLSVRASYDVIVAGGGIAGVAAALAARRTGAKTLLLEKSVVLGGLATLGLVAIYLPLCNGNGKQISAGIAEELLLLAGKYGFDTIPESWKTKIHPAGGRYATNYSPAAFSIAMEELLLAEGVDINYDTVVCRSMGDGENITHLIVENKSGRFAYGCKTVVDATGDADLFARAGVPFEKADNGLTYWTYTLDPKQLQDWDPTGRIPLDDWLDMGGADEYGESAPEAFSKYDGTEDRQVTQFLIDGRKCLREEVYENGTRIDRVILCLPGMAQMRTTRRIIGEQTLDSRHVNQYMANSVGCVADWRSPGPVWEIPYETLYARQCVNLFAAGRCISATADAWQCTRVIPGAAVTGQAAGTAAALCALQNLSAPQLPIEQLQAKLLQDGVILHA